MCKFHCFFILLCSNAKRRKIWAYTLFKTLPYQQTFRRRRGRFISPVHHFIIQQTHHKVYSVYNISEHTAGVGTDSSRPYIIHNPTNTPQGLFSAQMYKSEHSAGVGADLSRPYNRLLLLSRRLAKLLKSLQFDKYNSPLNR